MLTTRSFWLNNKNFTINNFFKVKGRVEHDVGANKKFLSLKYFGYFCWFWSFSHSLSLFKHDIHTRDLYTHKHTHTQTHNLFCRSWLIIWSECSIQIQSKITSANIFDWISEIKAKYFDTSLKSNDGHKSVNYKRFDEITKQFQVLSKPDFFLCLKNTAWKFVRLRMVQNLEELVN